MFHVNFKKFIKMKINVYFGGKFEIILFSYICFVNFLKIPYLQILKLFGKNKHLLTPFPTAFSKYLPMLLKRLTLRDACFLQTRQPPSLQAELVPTHLLHSPVGTARCFKASETWKALTSHFDLGRC